MKQIDLDPQTDKAELWKLEKLKGVTFFKAHFNTFCFDKHIHEDFALGVIESGAQRFIHKGHTWDAPSGAVITVNPDEVHDGRPDLESGLKYRMIYFDPHLVSEILHDYCNVKDKELFFSQPVTFDPVNGQNLVAALNMIDENYSYLEIQSILFQSVSNLFLKHSEHRISDKSDSSIRITKQAMDYIQNHAVEDISLEDISRSVGLSRFHFLRLFKKTAGYSPHFYLVHRRLLIARASIEQGLSLADTAFNAGFSDQSHLTRRFKSVFGLTPGEYKKIIN